MLRDSIDRHVRTSLTAFVNNSIPYGIWTRTKDQRGCSIFSTITHDHSKVPFRLTLFTLLGKFFRVYLQCDDVLCFAQLSFFEHFDGDALMCFGIFRR